MIPNIKGMLKTLAQRFWSKVNKNGPVPPHAPHLGPCWVWTAHRYTKGYGRIKVDGHGLGAHRVAWELTNGKIPAGKCVLHKCDNRPCCNPAHLFLGTKKDNMIDMESKKRHPHTPSPGESNGAAVLSEAKVLEIFRRVQLGERQQTLADEFGICRPLVSMIKSRRRWGHILNN